MRCIRNIFVLIISALSVLNAINYSQEAFVDRGIFITEEIIRNTANKLFSILKLKRDNPRLNQYIITNKHFASITLQDNDILNKIAKLSRANAENNNGSIVFMTAINELLNADNHNIDVSELKNDVLAENYDDHIVDIIETFLKRLRHARELHDVNSYVKINENVLNIIKEARLANTTEENQHDDYYLTTKSTSEEIEFWKPSARRIYGGERTKIKHFPFMASIQMFGNFQCAGSIIKSDLIITASSCLQLAWNNRFFRENPAFLSARVGSSFYSGGGEVISVLEVYFHPAYDPKTLRNNICVVRLTRKIKFSWRARRRVRKIDIDRHASKLPFNTPGITILGWGAKGQSNVVRDPWSNILSVAVLDIYPLRECQDIYSKEYVTYKNFCAGFISRGGGACNRDIGGPGIDDGILTGVVSFGSPLCGAADAPTVFTKLGYYANWIESIMEQEVPFSRKRTTLKPKRPRIPVTYKPLKTTQFKIPPLPGGKMKPIAINEIENVLRMFDDDLFHEFMRTMFDSQEMTEYKDVFKEVKEDMVNKILEDGKQMKDNGKELEENGKHIPEGKREILQDGQMDKDELPKVTSPYIEFDAETATKLIEFEAESTETVTQFDDFSKPSVLDGRIDSGPDGINDNIEELLKNIDLKKIIEEETFAAKKTANVVTESVLFDEIESQLAGGKTNESVLTLLYLSEEKNEKDKDIVESMEDAKGLSIATNSFQDLTRTKGKDVGAYNGMPEKELYEILSEVINDEMRNNKTKL